MRRPVIAGNWKMYKTQAETRAFFAAFLPLISASKHCDIIVAPPFTALSAAVESARGSALADAAQNPHSGHQGALLGAQAQGSVVAIAAQNLHWEREGAFTGEVSAPMLVESGCRAVIIGHSERRQYFGETDTSVNRKLKAALAAGLTPIVCVGETLAEREANHTDAVLQRQFEGGFASLTPQDFSRILVAYEPVWAIGTGRTATPEMASNAHCHVRKLAATLFTPELASALRILYGGSVKPDNIRGLMDQADIDGALVGGASLDPKSFAAIVNYQA